jgi:hypothetical protein
MKPIRRELLNGLFVLVLASLIHAAFEAFHLNFNVTLWALIVMGVAIAVSGYVMFEIALGFMASGETREKEWLKRLGSPARLEMNREGMGAGMSGIGKAVEAMIPGSDYTVMYYYGSEGGRESPLMKEANTIRETIFNSLLERLKRGAFREYKRILCFDNDVLANNHDLKSGVLRVGEGPGTIDRWMEDHCRLMMETKGCSLYVAPVVFRSVVVLYGVDKVSISVDTVDQSAGGRRVAGIMFLSDPPNGEIIEQFRQMERATERRMVAVHQIRFPKDDAPTGIASTG